MIAFMLAVAFIVPQDAADAKAQALNLTALTAYVEAVATDRDGSPYLSAEPEIEAFVGPDGARLPNGVASSEDAFKAYVGDCLVDPIKPSPSWNAPSSSEAVVVWTCSDDSHRVATFRVSDGHIDTILWGAPIMISPGIGG